jgi:ComF family protein
MIGFIKEKSAMVFRIITDSVYPRRCILCGEESNISQQMWCNGCLDTLIELKTPYCYGCGIPFEPTEHVVQHLCHVCSKGIFHFDAARSIFLFGGQIKEAIHRFKYHGDVCIGRSLESMISVVNPHALFESPIDLIVPVPLHPKRLRQRGFNQSARFARAISKRYKIELSLRALSRIRETRPQVELKKSERLENVRGAFSVRFPDEVRGRVVLLIDDIMTTGFTASECSKQLKAAGAEKVYVFTLLRAQI